MKKTAEHLNRVLSRVVFIGFGVQCVLGLWWMLSNCTGFLEFEESYHYLEASKTLVFDEYTGILYPFLLLCLETLLGEAVLFRVAVYLLQVGGFLAAGFYFWYGLERGVCRGQYRTKTFAGMASFGMLCIPQVAQCQLAISPRGLAVSACLLQLGAFFQVLMPEQDKKVPVIISGIAWLFMSLLMPEYVLFGLVAELAIFFLLIGMKKKMTGAFKQILLCGGVVALVLLVILGTGKLANPGAYGKVEWTPSFGIMNRMAANRLGDTYGYWPEDLKQCFTQEELRKCLEQKENISRSFGYTVQKRLGKQRADEVFLEVAEAAYQVYYVQVRRDFLWDVAGTVLAPVVIQEQLEDRATASYTGRIYDIVRMKAPRVTKIYMQYASSWFLVGIGLGVLSLVLSLLREFEWKKVFKGIGIISLMKGVAFAMILVYSFGGAGQMNYLNSTGVLLFWSVLMLWPLKWLWTQDRLEKKN